MVSLLVAGALAAADATFSATLTTTLLPRADAYVDNATPAVNYGGALDLRTENLPSEQESYLRFGLRTLAGPVRRATLRLYAHSTNPVGVAVHAVADTTWGETTITDANAPVQGSPVVNSPPTTQGTWVEVDVTSLVTGTVRVTLGLSASLMTGGPLHPRHYPQNDFASRETGSTAPQLVVESDTPTTTTTSATTTTTSTTTTSTTTTSTTTTLPSGSACGTASAPPARYDHVVIVMYENKNVNSVIGNSAAPYASGLARSCGYVSQYTDAGHFDSLPNYIALTSGVDNTPIQADCVPSPTCSTTVDNVFRQVRAAGQTAISYEESMGSNCLLTNVGEYRPKHNPAAFYVGVADRAACNTDDVDYGSFDPDHLPTLAFVTPNLIDDTHDGTVAQGDAWASVHVQAILDGASYRAGKTAVLWLWDEDTPMPNVIIAPSVRPGTVVTTPLGHYSSLRAVEEMLGLPLLGNAATATSLRGAFNL